MKTRPIPTAEPGILKPEFLQSVLGIILARQEITRGELCDILKRSGWQPNNGEITSATRSLVAEGFIFARFLEREPYFDSTNTKFFDSHQESKYY